MIESLLLRNLNWIRGIARTFCRNRDDAEDLAGDTVLKILLNADKYDADKSFRLWVLVIMRNTFRSGKRHTGIVEPFQNLPECGFFDDPSTYTISAEYLRLIEECARSSISVQTALLYAQGYSYNEIADMHDVSLNIVKSRVHHGRKLISRCIS